jgi:MATE family multidrug resistance protein
LGYTLARDRRLRGTPEQTWFGWSWACFDGWKTYLAYGLPATAMLCAEWWAFECTIFMAGLLPDAEVAVRSYTRRRSVALPLVARQSLVVRFF